MVIPFQLGTDPNFNTDGYLFPARAKVSKVQEDQDDDGSDEDDDDDNTSEGPSTGSIVNDEESPTMDITRVTALIVLLLKVRIVGRGKVRVRNS
jgi:hypothetical protein